MTACLTVSNLKTQLATEQGPVYAVDGLSFSIKAGETYAILGESGSGKSMAALSIMRILPENASVGSDAEIRFHDTDLLKNTEREMRNVRGCKIATIFQDPMSALNPVLSIGTQLREVYSAHGRPVDDARLIELLKQVRMPSPEDRLKDYPHQLSGGMKQRVVIAMALAAEPELMIADEPTTALDVTTQADILRLLQDLQVKHHMAVLLISHDIGLVADQADRIGVMYAGEIVEEADTKDFISAPKHPYSRLLLAALPDPKNRDQVLSVIRGFVPSLKQQVPGCRFADRCPQSFNRCYIERPKLIPISETQTVRCHLYSDHVAQQERIFESQAARPRRETEYSSELALHVQRLKVHFPIHRGVFRRKVGVVKAVDGASLSVRRGETHALVGESGCGKTTLGQSVLHLAPITEGHIHFRGQDLSLAKPSVLKTMREEMQIIFQDPFSSMNPRMKVADIVGEGLMTLGKVSNRAEMRTIITPILERVGLDADVLDRYPHEFSGGQRQRLCIARALAVKPQMIVCDEPTSALDVSVQAQVLNLLRDLQDEMRLSYLFITHNISVVGYMAHQVSVMYLGRIVETGPATSVLENPKHPYTQTLIAAVPMIDSPPKNIATGSEVPSAINPPTGCHFHPRCPKATEICKTTYPKKTYLTEEHLVKCHLYPE